MFTDFKMKYKTTIAMGTIPELVLYCLYFGISRQVEIYFRHFQDIDRKFFVCL